MNKEIKAGIIHGLYRLFWTIPIKKNRIVFSSFDNRKYGGNPRTISDALDADFEKIWVLDDDVDAELPADVKRVSTHSLRKIYYYATAKVWVDSHHFSNRWKRKSQYLIQTWHGAIPLKKLEGGCVEYFSPEHVRAVYECSKMTDLQISNSDYATDVMRKGMWYYGPVLQMGMPLNDELVKNTRNRILVVKRELKLQEDIKYILYAPTCRMDDTLDLVDALDYKNVVSAFEKGLAENGWFCIADILLQTHQRKAKYKMRR